MTVASKSASRTNTLVPPFAICGVASVLLLAALLRVFGVSLTLPALLIATVGLLWIAFRHPLGSLGTVLVFMPIFPIAFLIAKFFGPSYIGSLEGCDRAVVLVLVLILWWKNGIRFAIPDWLLLTCFGIAAAHLVFSGKLLPLLSDFNFMIAYAAGRVAVLTGSQEKSWADRAVWLVAALAISGLVEIFGFGEGPRTALYLSVAEQATFDGGLSNSFHAFGYSGMREAATMLGPLHFAPLCMAAFIIWWVYSRNPLPAAMVGIGLICTVTRSAWAGTALAVPVVALAMGQRKRLLLFASLVLSLFLAAIPTLGLRDYLSSTKTVQDPSAEDHQRMLSEGLAFMTEHPFGVGPGNAGRWATENYNKATALFVDDTYLTFAAEYGIPAVLCFLGFLAAALMLSWREETRVGYAAVGILVGFSTIMIFFDAHDVFALASWIWFPVGMAVRSSTVRRLAQFPQHVAKESI
jgi:hypothetical protein